MDKKDWGFILALIGLMIAALSFFYPWYNLTITLDIPDAPPVVVKLIVGAETIHAMSENPQIDTLLNSVDLKGRYAKYVFFFILAVALIGILRRNFLRTGIGLVMYVLGVYILLYFYPSFAPSFSLGGEITILAAVEILKGGYLLITGGIVMVIAGLVASG